MLLSPAVQKLSCGLQSYSLRTYFRRGLKNSCFAIPALMVHTYFVNPMCQLPNLASNQVLSQEQRVKNDLDDRYPDIFENSDSEFYYQLVQFDLKKACKDLEPYDKKRRALGREVFN